VGADSSGAVAVSISDDESTLARSECLYLGWLKLAPATHRPFHRDRTDIAKSSRPAAVTALVGRVQRPSRRR
jgi:hypothetical protein